jgi:hypothetical protein
MRIHRVKILQGNKELIVGVGRKRKQGKRERNGRIQRVSRSGDPKRSSVYVVEGVGAVKVGVSNNIARRISAIQTSQAFDVRVFWGVSLTTDDAYKIEDAAHRKLKKTVQHRGEWFHVSAGYARLVIEQEIVAAGITDWRPDAAYGVNRDGGHDDTSQAAA